ncbi:MAG: hypothetical protein WDO24_16215 [Pseudomonadota bacterium]
MFDGATTGLRGIDHWITDPVLTPPDSTERFTEQLVPLPRLMHYPPLESAPAVTALPASTGGAVTFGSFSNPIKISPPTIALWSRVLRAMPGSRLLLKYHTRFADPALELALPHRLRQPRRRARATAVPRRRRRSVDASVGLCRHRHRARHRALQRLDHDVRGPLDGRPGDHPGRRHDDFAPLGGLVDGGRSSPN